MSKELLEELKQKYPVNSILRGVVEYHAPFRLFVDIDHGIAKGLIQITDFLDEGIMSVDKFPPVGSVVDAIVLGYTEDDRNQIWLSMKPSKFGRSRQN